MSFEHVFTVKLNHARFSELKRMCQAHREYPHVLVQRAFVDGFDALHAKTVTARRETDACNLFREWLIDTRGYTKRGASTIASRARTAIKQADDLEELEDWVDVKSTDKHHRRSVLNRWLEFCEERNMDPLELELPPLEAVEEDPDFDIPVRSL